MRFGVAPEERGRGPSAALASGMDTRVEDTDVVLSARDAVVLVLANAEAGTGLRLETVVGYGLSAFGGRFTDKPYAGFGHSGTDRRFRLGWQLKRTDEPGAF